MTYVTNMERIAEKKGKLEGKLEDAEKMLKKGFSVEDIMEITGLSEKEIMAIKEKSK